MSVTVERLGGSMAKLRVELPAEELEKAIDKVYKQVKGRISLPGFRKGKAPRKFVEQYYGKNVFYEDAANELVKDNYPDAVEESEEDVVSSPSIEVEQVESGKPFIYVATVALKPPVKLGKYKGIEVAKMKLDISDEEVENEIDRIRGENSRIVDVTDRTTVKDGDVITLDYEGTMDGVPFEGGKAENYRLTIGSGQFIPGFEEGLIGAEVEKEVNVNVTFPEDYNADELAGRPAVFKCLVHKIQEKELPELTDDYVGDISEYETVDEYRKSIKDGLLKRRTDEEQAKRENEVVSAVIDDAEMELPDAMIETQQRQILNEMEMQLYYMRGIDMGSYLRMTGKTEEQLMEQARPQALERIRTRLVLEAVAEKEKIEATEEELEEELKKQAESARQTIEKYKENLPERELKGIKKDIAVRKAAEFLVENVKEKKK